MALATLFTHLFRGAYVDERLVNQCLSESVEDTVVLAFQTRDIRGGRGERKLFRDLMHIILKKPELSCIIRLIPEYGRWDDVWSLMGISAEVDNEIDRVVLEQFRLDQESESPSLLAKWLPREGNKNALHFANLLFPSPFPQRVYRKTVAYLNRLIDTTEIKMCARDWSSISPDSVPAQLFKRNKNAFLNRRAIVLRRRIIYSDRTNLLDRIVCANRFKEYMGPSFDPPSNEDLYTLLDSPRYDAVRRGLKG